MSRKSLQTPVERRSMLGFGKANALARQTVSGARVPEAKQLFSANRSIASTSKRWSGASTSAKDPRPLSNRGFQKEMVEQLLDFLNDTAYPHPITAKLMLAPTTKEFIRVFEHLYQFVNPKFSLNGKKCEEEVPKILKQMGYPYTISKSVMFSIGSMHSWPTLLAALQWMVEVIRAANKVDVLEDLLFPSTFADETSGKQEKMFFMYYTKTFEEFLSGSDDFEESDALVEEAVINQAGCSKEDHAALVQEVDELEKELATLEDEPDLLEEAIKEKTSLEEALEQEELSLVNLQQKQVVVEQQSHQYQLELTSEGVPTSLIGDPTRQEEIKHKSSEVKRKLEHLNEEKERLEALNDEREMRFAKMYDKVRSTVNEYNDIVRELVINPIVAKYLGTQSIVLQFDHSQKDIACVADCKERLKPALAHLASCVTDDRFAVESRKITSDEKLEHLSEMSLEREHERAKLRSQLDILDREVYSKSERFTREYDTRSTKTALQKTFVNEERAKINAILQEATQLLEQDRIHYEDMKVQMESEQESYADFLMAFCKEVQTHKRTIIDRVQAFNKELYAYAEELKSQENQPPVPADTYILVDKENMRPEFDEHFKTFDKELKDTTTRFKNANIRAPLSQICTNSSISDEKQSPKVSLKNPENHQMAELMVTLPEEISSL